mmetsp:Transcript_12727/g.21453  ORF Transcript_12727/g.21453 Transcript_12727/m.21453 type:complete len:182 (-) Transcript_12727:35-580(-)
MQQRAKFYMMKRQREVMGKSNFMAQFLDLHRLAFHSKSYNMKEAGELDLHLHGGLPETGSGCGLYSQRLSYREWHRQSCARLGYNELVESNPLQIFNLLVGAVNFPYASILFGFIYEFSASKRFKAFLKDDGVKEAKASVYSKIKCLSVHALRLLAGASMMIMVYKSNQTQIDDLKARILN